MANDLYLYGDIGDAWWGEGVTALQVGKFLDVFDAKAKELTIRINSVGGMSWEGVAMRKLISDFKAKRKLMDKDFTVNVMIDGICASAATLPMLAGDKIVAALGSEVMIHRCWVYASGNAVDLKATADELERSDLIVSELYAAFTKKKKEDMYDLMAAETYFSPEEALAVGLVTHVEEIEEAVVSKAYQKAGYERNNRPYKAAGSYAKMIAARMAKHPEKKAKVEERQQKLMPLDMAFVSGDLTADEYIKALERAA